MNKWFPDIQLGLLDVGFRTFNVTYCTSVSRRVDIAFGKLRTYQVTQTGVPVNVTMAPQRYMITVAGQLADTPTRGLPTCGLDDSQTGHLADWSTRGLDKSRTGQLADATCDCVLSFRFFGHSWDRELSSPQLVQSASCLVRELTSPRDVQSASWQSASWRICELSSYHVYMDIYIYLTWW